jgi:hypothetical protein
VGGADSVVVPDLRQDAGARSNVGIFLGGGFESLDFRIEIRDSSGALAGARDGVHLELGGVLQMNSILRDVAPGLTRGWARIIPSSGDLPPPAFTAYGVVNDGAEPGQGTDDGSFVPAVPE